MATNNNTQRTSIQKKGGIVILDFGSQYNQLIARRVRELGVFAEILPFDTSLEIILTNQPKAYTIYKIKAKNDNHFPLFKYL